MGGKEIFDYAILRNDTAGILFGIGVLGSMDMEMIWSDIISIAKKNKYVSSGDTDCAQANTAMFIAGGLLDKNLAHTTRNRRKGNFCSKVPLLHTKPVQLARVRTADMRTQSSKQSQVFRLLRKVRPQPVPTLT